MGIVICCCWQTVRQAVSDLPANAVSIAGSCSLRSFFSESSTVWVHADAEGAPGNQLGAAADMDEKELAQRDAHIRSFAIAQVLHIPRAYLLRWQCCRLAEYLLAMCWSTVCRRSSAQHAVSTRHCCVPIHIVVMSVGIAHLHMC